MRRSNHENIDVLMLIGLVTGEEGEEGGKSHSKVGTRWVRQRGTPEIYYDTKMTSAQPTLGPADSPGPNVG